MKNIILLLFFIGITSVAKSATVEWGAAGQDYVLSADYTIASGDTVIVLGNFFDTTNDEIIISAGATLIVHGDMKLTNTKSTIDGNVIVLGDVDLKNTDMISSGNLVVGGVLSSSGGNLNDVNGDVYLLDPEANSPLQVTLPNPPLDIEDLLTDSNDNSLIDIISDNVDNTGNAVEWDGENSSIWSEAINWLGNSIPNALDSVVIESVGVSPVCPLSLTLQDLTIKAGATLTIPVGSQITVLGNINIQGDGQLIVQNSNSNPTSFIVYGDVMGDITFRWTYNSGNWWFIGHPISNALMTTSYDNILLTNGGTNDYVLYDYQDPDVLSKISKTNKDFSGESPIKGYLFKVKDDNTLLEMTGQVNNDAEYSKALQTEWQVIANPYPSYYQLPLEDAADINADFYHTTGTVYVTESTRNSDKTYNTYNTLTGISSPSNTLVNGIIAPGQAFYVKTSTAGNIKMRSANRVHAVGTQLKSTIIPKETDVLRIKIENESGGVDEAVLAFRQDGQHRFSRLDSEQRFTTNSLSYVYSVVEGNKAVINVLPRIEEDWQQTIGINSKQGLHKVYLEGLETLTTELEVLLEDKNKKVFTNLDGQTVYEFSTEEGSFDERFVLHLNIPAVSTDIDIADGKAYDAKVYLQNNSELVIEHDWDEPQVTVMIYGISGELLFQEGAVARKTVKPLVLSTGIYVVKLIGRDRTFEQKVMIK